MVKSAQAFRTISEVSQKLDVPQHVLRFWESKFTHVRPLKRGGGRRYYRPDDIALLKAIKSHLYQNGYTIKGVQKLLKQSGVRHLIMMASDTAVNGASVPADTSALGAIIADLQDIRDQLRDV